MLFIKKLSKYNQLSPIFEQEEEESEQKQILVKPAQCTKSTQTDNIEPEDEDYESNYDSRFENKLFRENQQVILDRLQVAREVPVSHLSKEEIKVLYEKIIDLTLQFEQFQHKRTEKQVKLQKASIESCIELYDQKVLQCSKLKALNNELLKRIQELTTKCQ